MRDLARLLAVVAIAACGSGAGEADSGSSSGGETDAPTTTAPDPTTAGPGDPTTGTGTASTASTGSDSATTEPGTTTTTDTATGTTGEMFCGLGTTGDSGGAPGPWLEVVNDGEPLTNGQTLRLQCGFQGSFMFEVKPYVGGYAPVDDYSHLEIWLDVEGFNDDPAGHFWSREDYSTFIGCPEDEYYTDFYLTTIQMIPSDEIVDKTALHGLPAHLEVTMHTPSDGSVTVGADLVIEAIEDEMWMFCTGY